jgi:hypothetical protein
LEGRCLVADRVRKVNYCYLTVPHRAGHGAKILGELRDARVNLLGYTGFPASGRKAQLDFVAENTSHLRRVAKRSGWKLSKTKRGFLIQGKDELGAVYRHLQKLADERINIIAADAISAGRGRYGMLIWVKPRDFSRASKVLRAK